MNDRHETEPHPILEALAMFREAAEAWATLAEAWAPALAAVCRRRDELLAEHGPLLLRMAVAFERIERNRSATQPVPLAPSAPPWGARDEGDG